MTFESVPDLPSQLAVKVMHEIGSNDPDLYGRIQETLSAALAAAPQPAPEREALELPPHDALTVALFEDAEGALTSYQCVKLADKMLARGLRLPGGNETMAWAVVGGDRIPNPHLIYGSEGAAKAHAGALGLVVRVAIRVVEGGDDDRLDRIRALVKEADEKGLWRTETIKMPKRVVEGSDDAA